MINCVPVSTFFSRRAQLNRYRTRSYKRALQKVVTVGSPARFYTDRLQEEDGTFLDHLIKCFVCADIMGAIRWVITNEIFIAWTIM